MQEPEVQQLPDDLPQPPEEPKPLFDLMMQPADNQGVQYGHLCTQIDNILNSYDDEFDAFSELVQNSMDSLFEMCEIAGEDFVPRLEVHIDCKQNQLSVLDNGIGVEPKDFASAIKPNESLKRRLRHKNARGEKGAALVFLQFGHTMFHFESKTGAGQQSYRLENGRKWFRQMLKAMDSDVSFDQKQFPAEAYVISNEVSAELGALESGCKVTVQFGAGCRVESLEKMLGESMKYALNRIEHILRTRTAIGFVTPSDRPNALPQCLQKMQVNVRVTLADESQKSRRLDVGFHYPHLLAKSANSTTALMTAPKRNSELLYDFITLEFMEKHLFAFLNRKNHRAIAEKYAVNGYFSYGYQNGYYEQIAEDYMGLTADQILEDDLPYQLVQINGGFQLAVKSYPDEPLQMFLHRCSGRDENCAYMLLNFGGDYNSGRKNIYIEGRDFIIELCKELTKFSTTSERLRFYKVNASRTRSALATAHG